MTGARTEHRVRNAMLAWEDGRRRRRATGAVDRAADAALAAGGMILANVALPLGFGLPGGRAGTWLGMGLAGAGFAWIARHRRAGAGVPLEAASARMRAATPALSVARIEAQRAA